MTIITVRPNANVLAAGWRNEAAGTSLFGSVDDEPANDSTYIVGTVAYPNYGYYCRIGAAEIPALAADERVMRLRLRARYAKAGASGTDRHASITVWDSVTGSTHSSRLLQAKSATVSEITFPWWTESPNGTVWNKTGVDRLGFVCYNHLDYAGVAVFVRIHEIYADVDIHQQVTISSLDVIDETVTATPSVTWVYDSNIDLDLQRSYQVKIFTLAQTTAAGFDPAGDEPVWDSGQVRSTNTSVVVQTALVNGVSYVAYVRVASDFNGTDWWISYSASSTFTMNYTAPPTPTLTVTQETTLPSLRNLLVVDTKLNLLSADDASFENGLGTWTALANCAVVQSATQALHGIQSMRLTASGAGNMSAITIGGVFSYLAKPVQQYTALASFRAQATGRSCRVLMQWIDNAGVLISTATGSNVSDTSAGWIQGFVTGTAPAGAAGIRVLVEMLSAAAAEQHYVDQVSLHTGATTTWFAGGLQKQDSIGFERRDRTVIEFLDWHMPTADTTNILNPNMATGGESYQEPNHGFWVRHPEDRMILDRSGLAREGEACVRWIVGEGTGSILDLGTRQGVFSVTEVPTATLPGVPGRTYTLSFYLRSVSGSHDLRLNLVGIDQAGATVGSTTSGGTVSVGTSWSRLTVTHTMPAGAVAMRGELANLGGTLAEFLLDQGQLEEGSTATIWHQSTILIPDWQPVRGALTALQGDVRDGVARIYDRETPPGVIRMYRAWMESQVDTSTVIRSSFTAYISTTITPFGGTDAVLKDPQQPAWDLLVRVQQRGERIDEDATEFHPIRPNDRQPFGKRPVTVSDWISGKNGQMSIFVDNDQDWLALQALLHTPRTLLLQFPEGGQRYIRFSSRSWPIESKAGQDGAVAYWRRIVADFTEVSRPAVTG